MWVLQSGNVAKNNLTSMDGDITQSTKKTNEKSENVMWVLWGDNVTKCNLPIMDANIVGLAKKTNENFERLT